MATRKQVYTAIDSERDYQDAMRKKKGWSEKHSVGDYLTMLRHYVAKGDEAWNVNTGEAAALEFIRKVGGIAVACMETNGAPLRQIPEDLKDFLPLTQ